MMSFDRVKEFLEDSDGFGTAKGKLTNSSELHAMGLGAMPYYMAWSLNIPYGQEMMYAIGLGLLGVKGYRTVKEHMHDDMVDESHYVWVGMTATDLAINYGDQVVGGLI